MAAIIALAIILGVGVTAYQASLPSIIAESVDKNTYSPYVRGYEELSNQVVDPRNYISNVDNTPIWKTEYGPFGIPRNIHHNRGDFDVVTWGFCPGLHCNV